MKIQPIAQKEKKNMEYLLYLIKQFLVYTEINLFSM